jgi:hypothetical protein
MTDDITPPKEPKKSKRKRNSVMLTAAARAELAERRQIEQAVSYFLDLEQSRSLKQIADEMGISVSSLKRLSNDPQFHEVYNEILVQLGHHPRLQALNTQLPELIPDAYRALKRLLGPGTAHTAQVSAVKLLFDTLKIGDQVREEDPQALENFMKGKGVIIQNNVMNVNLPIPEEYRQAFSKWMGNGEIVDANATDVPAISPMSESNAEAPS